MGVRLSGTAGLRRTLARLSLRPGWVAVATAVGVALTVDLDRIPLALRYLPLVASALVVGLPHGAVDHLTPAWASEETPTRRSLLAVGLCYFLLGGAYAAAWALAPAAAFAFFLVLTWLHWGQGDVYPLVALFPVSHLDDRLGRALTAAVRGGLPMVVPLLGFPERYAAVAGRVVGLFDPAAGVAWLTAPGVRIALGLSLAALTAAALGRGLVSRGPTRSLRVDAAETILLWAFFLTVPPVLAIGLYFPLWHGLRHVGRLVAVDPGARAPLRDGDVTGTLWRFARVAAPLTVASLVLLAALAVALPSTPETTPDLAAAYLVLLAVLTLPHVVVVSWLDRQQGVWTSTG